ncbi:MAG: phosphoglycerate dehydrogenase [Methanomassiliicoccales archaeon]|jgi:D-3-phosphoglycerate dehydrogenase|nr:phosphoglycerate dehydrogenase [Methanomassiliicoccales archaeon]
MKLLVTDELSKDGLEMLTKGTGLQVDVKPGIPQDELIKIIGEYEGIIIRSGTKVTKEVIEAGRRLKVVGRAGVGVDNVDVETATRKGVLVMNTPMGNIVSAAEHTMAMMLTLVRKIVWADASIKSGKWERGKFTGTELNGKTLGIVGIGRIGAEVAKRAKAFQMKMVGYDPFLPPEVAVKLGVRLLPLEKVIEEADMITIHAPLTPSTKHLVGKDQFKLMKPHAMVVNCARGGIVDEEALYEALKSKRIAGAALDVFEQEPPKGSKLLELDNIVLTPHLGASTKEAQEKVSLEMAECVKAFLVEGKISNAVNAPLSKIDPKLMAFMPLTELLASFAFQLVDGPVKKIETAFFGELASADTKTLTTSAIIGVLSNIIGDNQVNIINAASIAKEKGIQVSETKSEESPRYVNMVAVRLHSDGIKREVRGTVFPGTQARLLGIDEYDIDMPVEGDFLMTKHNDVPGIIGRVGTVLGDNHINIARMGVGRESRGGMAVMLVAVDDVVSKEVLDYMLKLKDFKEARFIRLTQMRWKTYIQ